MICLWHPSAAQGSTCVHVTQTVKTWGRFSETSELTAWGPQTQEVRGSAANSPCSQERAMCYRESEVAADPGTL